MPGDDVLVEMEQFVLLRREVARRIVDAQDAGAALYYLACALHGRQQGAAAQRLTGLSEEQLQRAEMTVFGIRTEGAPDDSGRAAAPRYTAAELRRARTEDAAFAAVCRRAEDVQQKPLTEGVLRALYHGYETLRLPADVLIDLVSFLATRGPLTSRAIQRECVEWADRGIFDGAASAAFLQQEEMLAPRVAAMARELKREPEALSDKERAQLERYARQGFDAPEIALALSRMARAGRHFSWRYLTGMLNSWHDKGLHTCEQIEQAEPAAKPAATPAQKAFLTQQPPEGPLEEWETQWLAQLQAHEKEKEQT